MRYLLLLSLLLSGCAVVQKAGFEFQPEVTVNKLEKEFDAVPSPDGKKLTVAVYSFKDLTGQRKPTPGIASFSTAVTQGAEVFLIRALQDVGKGQWFDVVERVNVDNLTKERTIIRQMREAYEGKDAKPLMPLQFAGIILEGGIIGYDSGNESGGAAHRFLGIGTQTQYSKDIVTISLRAVSVNTGKVLASVTVQKIVYSTADSVAVLKFIQNGTQAFEAETGLTINEAGTLAVKATIEAAVVELIKEGERKGVWDYKKAVVVAPKAVKKEEPKLEEKKDEKPISEVLPTKNEEPKIEEKKSEVKPVDPKEFDRPTEQKIVIPEVKTEVVKSPVALFGERKLKSDEYIYSEPTNTATKKWLFKKNTIVTIRAPGSDGWVKILDSESRGGWVRLDVLDKIQ
jgi:curli production assembly/transport component CsgG